jgi:hypothetical protein
MTDDQGGRVLAYRVDDSARYGVLTLDEQGKALAITKKPANPASHYAVTGLYFFDAHAVEFAKQLTPSARGELEISDINRRYLAQGQLQVTSLGRGCAWLDTGSPDSLQEAEQFIQALEKRQGLKVAYPEEIAWRQGWSNDEQLQGLAEVMVLTPETWFDQRGYFWECFRQTEFEHHCCHHRFVQDNVSHSRGCTLRGLHYQCTHPQGKLVQAISRRIFDVAVDVRRSRQLMVIGWATFWMRSRVN